MDTPSPDPVAATLAEVHWRRRPVLYPDRYAWYILASVMDIAVTVSVLIHYGAREVNSIAQASIELFGTWGLIGLKFLTLVIVIAICEYVGRRHERLGRVLATIAIGASLTPVLAATVQVFVLWGRGELMHTEWPRPLDDVPSSLITP
jgi:uncharacterized membrane protein